MSDYLYKYTDLNTLALILKNQTIRLNPLTTMDDKQETWVRDCPQLARCVFVSSWTNLVEESIPMWDRYSNMKSGVRIGIRRNAIQCYSVPLDRKGKPSSIMLPGCQFGYYILPYSECITERYFLCDLQYDKALEKVEYTDDLDKLKPKLCKQLSNNFEELEYYKLGRYKHISWQYQQEERFILRVVPYSTYKLLEKHNNGMTMPDIFSDIPQTIPNFFDLKINNEAFDDIEITLAPNFEEGYLELLRAFMIFIHKPQLKIVKSRFTGLL